MPTSIKPSSFKKIIERGTELAIIHRPRRFGKNLNTPMLKCFLETEKDLSFLFSKFKIRQTKHKELNGKYPVIFFTLKGVKQETWKLSHQKIKILIASEFERYRYLLEGTFNPLMK